MHVVSQVRLSVPLMVGFRCKQLDGTDWLVKGRQQQHRRINCTTDQNNVTSVKRSRARPHPRQPTVRPPPRPFMFASRHCGWCPPYHCGGPSHQSSFPNNPQQRMPLRLTWCRQQTTGPRAGERHQLPPPPATLRRHRRSSAPLSPRSDRPSFPRRVRLPPLPSLPQPMQPPRPPVRPLLARRRQQRQRRALRSAP